MRVYLAGKVPKGEQTSHFPDWRAAYIEAAPWIEFLTPINKSLDYSDAEGVFGHDCHLIQRSDAIIVNASSKLGVGTSQEILVAKYFKKFVICVAPRGTHHRRAMLNTDGITPIDDWIHPFIKSTVDEIFCSIDECVSFLNDNPLPTDLSNKAKGIDVIDSAITHYLTLNSRQGKENGYGAMIQSHLLTVAGD